MKNLKKYLEIAKPGDILLSRGNWNASNASIPGFRKHMSMYLGTGEYLKKNFKNFSTHLQTLKNDSHYMIEATGEGVTVSTMKKFAGHIDYLGVVRTSFKKEKIKRAIISSLDRIGSGYDHLFNFYSNKSVVCSELILKSYFKEFEGDEGIEVSLEKKFISLTFPPNNLPTICIKEGKKEIPSVRPIFFIDSLERTGENFVSSNEKFLRTWKRPRLSFFLK